MNTTLEERRFTVVSGIEVHDEWVNLVEQVDKMGMHSIPHDGPSGDGLLMRVRNHSVEIFPVYSKEPSVGLAEMKAEITRALQATRGIKRERKRRLPDPDPGKVMAEACQTALSLWKILRVDSMKLDCRHDCFRYGAMKSLILSITLRFKDDKTEARYIKGDRVIQYELFRREHLEAVQDQIDYWLMGMVQKIVDGTKANGGIVAP